MVYCSLLQKLIKKKLNFFLFLYFSLENFFEQNYNYTEY